jgi:hypothetical protein
MKICKKCLIEKPADDFGKSKQNKDGLYSYCRPCARAYNAERREHRKFIMARNRLQKIYGLSWDTYQDMAKNGCWVCGRTEEENGRMLCVDHDHACCPGEPTCGKCVRGILCIRCNWHVGMLETGRLQHSDLIPAMCSYLSGRDRMV